MVIDNSKYWKDFPKRSRSLICRYNSSNYYRVIPLDGSIWGETNERDFWSSFKRVRNDQSMWLDSFNKALSSFKLHQ